YGPIPSKELEETFKSKDHQINSIKKKLDQYFLNIPHHYDKVLLVDLYRLIVKPDLFNQKIFEKAKKQTLSAYRDAAAAKVIIASEVKSVVKDLFHDLNFKAWRKEHEKEFLKQKRKEEKSLKQYPKPYIDYLDALENQHFQVFWDENQYDFL